MLDLYVVGQVPRRYERETVRFTKFADDTTAADQLEFNLFMPALTHVRNGSSLPLPRINGSPVSGEHRVTCLLRADDVVTWGDSTYVIGVSLQPSPEEQQILRALQTDPVQREVYADWLETRGADQCAEYTRLVAQPQSQERRDRLESLNTRVSKSFRSMVAVGRIERCATSGCPSRWENLPLSLIGTRQCAVCERGVGFVDAPQERRGPIVIDQGLIRIGGDIDSD